MAWRNDVVTGLEAIGGQGHLTDIYGSVERVRQNLGKSLPISWEAIVRRELEYNSSDSESYKGRFDLFYSAQGLGKGVWGLRSMFPQTPEAVDLSEPDPQRVPTQTYRILRDTKLARQLKILHGDTCQLCRKQTKLSSTRTYSEAHHIRPLGAPYNGPDVTGNILVLCPTCHVLCDYAAVELTAAILHYPPGYEPTQRFLDHHNARYAKNMI